MDKRYTARVSFTCSFEWIRSNSIRIGKINVFNCIYIPLNDGTGYGQIRQVINISYNVKYVANIDTL